MKPFYFAKRRLQFVPAVTILVALVIAIPLAAQTITTFDAPGAGTGLRQGTYALCIDPSGTIIGFSRDANEVRHGFIRSRDGSFTIFDAPGAGTAAGQGTRAYSTNASGTITGFFSDSGNTAHGYVRSSQGVFTVFDAPGAGTGLGQGTFPLNSPQLINSNGAITGYYVDSAFVRHGFLRDENGVITTFDAPGAGTGVNQGTQSFAISPGRDITGFYFDGTNAVHGFLRDKKGVITTFDLPGAGTGPFEGTYGGGFTPNGTILGVLIDADFVNHGFLLDKNGALTTFDAPDAGNVPGSFQGTLPWGINTNGAIAGYYVDGTNVNHGFVRDKQGAIVEFDVPGAANMGNWGSIAPNGAVAGFYFDANG